MVLAGRTKAASVYASSIVARRGVWQSLYYDALNNWRESNVLGKRRQKLFVRRSDGSAGFRAGKADEALTVTDAHTVSLGTAQDSAYALMVILDYSLQRFAREAQLKNVIDLGQKAYGGATFNEAIYALANQARHLHAWMDGDKPSKRNATIFSMLALDPSHGHAACAFLENLRLKTYLDFEERVLSTPRDILTSGPAATL